jgi:protein-L-isoaspartate(D-aspartate) O-methyltransferase
MALDEYRQFYADEIRLAANLRSQPLADAFATVRREDFLGPSPWLICSADQVAVAAMGSGSMYVTTTDPRDLYHNVLAAIDASRHLNNGHPSTLARWIDALDLRPGDRVYHVGCGVGYYTAILAEMVGPRGAVLAIEVDSGLAERAKQNLAAYSYVSVFAGDGAAFDPGVCDAMLINAGVTHPHATWLERLASDGRMVLPLTHTVSGNFGNGVMVKISRTSHGLAAQTITYAAIFSCTSVRDPELDSQLQTRLANHQLRKLKSIRLDAHEKGDTCLVHGRDICISTAEPGTVAMPHHRE